MGKGLDGELGLAGSVGGELIEGELIAMSPIGSEHAGAVNALTRLLVQAVGERGTVAVQNPVRLDDLSEPQPDFAVLKPRADDYRRATPRRPTCCSSSRSPIPVWPMTVT